MAAHARVRGAQRLVAVILEHAEVKRLQHLCRFSDPIPVRRARDPPELFPRACDF